MWHVLVACVFVLCDMFADVQFLFDSLPVQILNVCCAAVSVVQLPSYISTSSIPPDNAKE